MAYATPTDLSPRLAPDLLLQLADDDGDGLPDEALLDSQLAAASAAIDQALAGRYELPLDPPPAIVTQWTVDFALEALHLRRGGTLPDELGDRVTLARRALQAIADGLARLTGATPRLADLAADSTRRGHEAVFDDEELRAF